LDPRRLSAAQLVRHTEFLRALARGLVGDRSAADDVVQDTWVAALTGPPREERALRAWLRTVVRRVAWRRHRGDRRRASREQAAARPEAQPDAIDAVALADVQQQIGRALAALGADHRSVLVDRFYLGSTLQDIAARSGIAVSSASDRVRRALDALRSSLDETNGGRRDWHAVLVPMGGTSGLSTTGAATAAGLGGIAMGTKGWVAAAVVLAGVIFLVTRTWTLPDRRVTGSEDDAPREVTLEGDVPQLVGRADPLSGAPVVEERVGVLPAAPTGRLRVIVRNDRGLGVRARLLVVAATWDSLGAPVSQLGPRFAEATSDDTGVHAFALAPGSYRVRAEAEGLAPVDSAAADVREGEEALLEVVVGPGVSARVRVRDAQDRSVPGARVRIGGPMGVVREIVTDAEGAGEASGFPIQIASNRQPQHVAYWRWRLWYTVEAAGFALLEGSAALPHESGETELLLRLVRGTAVRVRAVDPTGKPVPGVRVLARTERNAANPVPTSIDAVSDATGWADLGRLSGTQGSLTIHRVEPPPYTAYEELVLEGETLEHTVVLPSVQGTVRGRVRGPDGGAVAGVRVGVVTRERWDVTPAFATHRADDDGRFELVGVLAGEVDLVVVGDAFVLQRFAITLAPGVPRDLGDLRLEGGGRIAGRIVPRDGGDVGVVEVTLTSQHQHPALGHQTVVQWAATKTTETGGFAFEGVPEGTEFRIDLSSGTWTTSHPWPRAVRAGDVDVRAVVKPREEGRGAPVRFHVVTEDGSYTGPLSLSWIDGDGRRCGADEVEAGTGEDTRTFRVWTAPGSYELDLYAPGFLPTSVSVLVEDRPTDAVTTVRLDRGAGISFRILDGDGRPRGDTTLVVSARGGDPANVRMDAKTDRLGRVRLTGLRPGPEVDVHVELAADPQFTFAWREDVRVPGDLTVTLVRGGILDVRTQLLNGEVDGDVVCRLLDDRGAVASEMRWTRAQLASMRPERRVSAWAHAPGGTYRLEVWVGETTWTRDVTLTDGVRDVVELEPR
jgi:RNA polymerase sigma-70 factor (ECF subfamily)